MYPSSGVLFTKPPLTLSRLVEAAKACTPEAYMMSLFLDG